MNRPELWKEAQARYEAHKGQSSQFVMSPLSEYMSLIGEERFSQRSGLPRNKDILPSGDNGSDFDTNLGPLDVKTAELAFNLLVKVNSTKSNVYVLARYLPWCEDVAFCGWEFVDKIFDRTPKRFMSDGPLNYWIPQRELRGMYSLWERL